MTEGICPKCGSENLDYQDSEEKDEYLVYEFECEKCGATGKEWYTVSYLETVLNKKD